MSLFDPVCTSVYQVSGEPASKDIRSTTTCSRLAVAAMNASGRTLVGAKTRYSRATCQSRGRYTSLRTMPRYTMRLKHGYPIDSRDSRGYSDLTTKESRSSATRYITFKCTAKGFNGYFIQRCQCSSTCPNRIAQQPRSIPLDIFTPAIQGWGVRALRAVKAGQVLGTFTG
jgi:hypothetical protein